MDSLLVMFCLGALLNVNTAKIGEKWTKYPIGKLGDASIKSNALQIFFQCRTCHFMNILCMYLCIREGPSITQPYALWTKDGPRLKIVARFFFFHLVD